MKNLTFCFFVLKKCVKNITVLKIAVPQDLSSNLCPKEVYVKNQIFVQNTV